MEVKICGYKVLIDKEDLPIVKNHNWCPIGIPGQGIYFMCHEDGQTFYLHRMILPTLGKTVDHKNRDTLDCRKENLRPATRAEQEHNKEKLFHAASKYRGVLRVCNRWEARITFEKRVIYLGRFTDEIEAAKAYDNAAMRYYKDRANPNFPK